MTRGRRSGRRREPATLHVPGRRASGPPRPAARLVDTSAWVEALRKDGDPDVATQVSAALEDGHAVTCRMVLLELWNGTGSDRDRRAVQMLEDTLDVLDIDDATWREAAALAQTCRAAGHTIPAADLLIAACAAQRGAVVLHRDAHFDTIVRLVGAGQASPTS